MKKYKKRVNSEEMKQSGKISKDISNPPVVNEPTEESIDQRPYFESVLYIGRSSRHINSSSDNTQEISSVYCC